MELDIGRERNFCIACSPQKTKTMQQTKVPKILANFNERFAKSLQTFIAQGLDQTDTNTRNRCNQITYVQHWVQTYFQMMKGMHYVPISGK